MSGKNDNSGYGHFQGNGHKAIEALTGLLRYRGLDDNQRELLRGVRRTVEDITIEVVQPDAEDAVRRR